MTDLTRRDFVRAGAAGAAGLLVPFDVVERAIAKGHGQSLARALRELRRRLHGSLFLPGNPNYLKFSQPANARYSGHPVAVAQVAGEHDVVTCIDWAREHRIQPIARGGGHSYAGFSTGDGLIIDLSRLNGVHVDKRTGMVNVGGAALNKDMLDATINGNFILPGGTCLGVAYGGLTLGGGIGFNTHWAGLSCDHLRSTRVVTASGDVLHVDARHHPDLFWACRGGAGGNFGVNTSFTFQIPPVPRAEVSFYSFQWAGADDAGAVLSTFDKILEWAPHAFNADSYAQATPVGSGGPRAAIKVVSRGQYIGPMSELKELVQPLLDVATPVTPPNQRFFRYPFWTMQKMFASAEAPRHSFGDLSRFSRRPLPDNVMAKLMDLLAACPSRDDVNNGSMWSLGWIGGETNTIGRHETAYVHRDMLTLLRATPDWARNAPRSVGDGLIAWAADMIKIIAPHTPAESYQNFPNRGIEDPLREYYAENLPRLVRVKRKYDKHNVFRNAQSIPTHV